MVGMAVGKQDSLRSEGKAAHFPENFGLISSGIYNDTIAGLRVPAEVAVDLKRGNN
jgi:hypothetical protein